MASTSSVQDILVDKWYSLSPGVREWIVKIVVTVVIALLWHVWLGGGTAREEYREADLSNGNPKDNGRRRGVDRTTLEPLPEDLVLEERVSTTIDDPVTNTTTINDEDKDNDDGDNNLIDSENAARIEKEHNDKDNNATEQTNATEDVAPRSARRQNPSPANTETSNTGRTLRTRAGPTTTDRPLIFANQSRDHPGLEAFWQWCDVECSLFRIYSRGRKDGTAVHPPYIPRSRSGQVKVSLQCTNRTGINIQVYWMDYKGKHVPKGKIRPGTTWTQVTWIEHPWIFSNAETDEILLYYIPDRIIPTCAEKPTVDVHDPDVGVHRFELVRAFEESPYWIEIRDPVLPFPAKDHIKSPEQAAEWALLHMHRMKYVHWDILVKYLTNILHEPANAKYRQIRIANPTFFQSVWQTPARGLLLAMGFVEQGAFLELGTAKRLTREQVKQLSSLMFSVSIWRKRSEAADAALEQPAGADGFGRAGYGRVDGMNYSSS